MSHIDRIVVGVKHSPAAESGLRWALHKAQKTGSSITAVHVFDVAERSDLAMERDPVREEAESQHRAQARVSQIVSEADVDVPVLFSSAHGSVETLLAAAAQRASALVVGQPQCDRHRHLVRQLALTVSCPVVVVAETGVAVTVRLPHPSGSSPLDESAELGV